jgi:hypothetical protein
MYLFAVGLLAGDFYQQAVETHKCFDSGSICFELVKGLPAAFVALVIGLVAAGIAWRQYRVAKAKLNLDLFDKRYAVFLETWKILSAVSIEGPQQEHGLFTPFNNFIPQAAFLFGDDIEAYLHLAVKNWTDFLAAQALADGGQGEARLKAIARRAELEQWFETEAKDGAKKRFGEYMSFETWK